MISARMGIGMTVTGIGSLFGRFPVITIALIAYLCSKADPLRERYLPRNTYGGDHRSLAGYDPMNLSRKRGYNTFLAYRSFRVFIIDLDAIGTDTPQTLDRAAAGRARCVMQMY